MPPPAATIEPLALEVGKSFEIVCTTKAVNVAEEAKVSEGALRLKLESKSATGSDSGSWSVVSVDATHPASFAFIQRESCATGCPLDLATERGPTLWGPVKTMPDKLEGGKSLSLAAIDAKTWQIRISTYRDRQIASLEQGECKKAP
jgi:hypothetical protein